VRVFVASAGALVVIFATPGSAPPQEPPAKADATPAPSPAPTPSPAPARLRLDVDRHIDEMLSRQETSGLPRFEDRVEVVDRTQSALDALLRDLDLACSAASAGPPPTSELNRFRGAPIPMSADLLGLARLIVKGVKTLAERNKPPRFILYAVRHGETIRLVLREGELPASVRLAVPGTTWEELARFKDKEQAAEAMRRLEHGYASLARQTSGEPAPAWAPIRCQPPGFR
jgi:hypothetical protein